MTFLPDNYELPETPSKYMKFKKGMNRFRILTPAVIGYEYWNLDNKPVRSKKMWKEQPEDIKRTKDGVPTDVKHFWAFVVWNYAEKAIQILEITQSTIQRGIKAGVDLRQGSATKNDIGVERSGEGFDTEYSVQFADPTPVSEEIEKAFNSENINLEALFSGEDPFGSATPTKRGTEPNLEPQGASNNEVDVEDIPF